MSHPANYSALDTYSHLKNFENTTDSFNHLK